jgi:hypothetical protein
VAYPKKRKKKLLLLLLLLLLKQKMVTYPGSDKVIHDCLEGTAYDWSLSATKGRSNPRMVNTLMKGLEIHLGRVKALKQLMSMVPQLCALHAWVKDVWRVHPRGPPLCGFHDGVGVEGVVEDVEGMEVVQVVYMRPHMGQFDKQTKAMAKVYQQIEKVPGFYLLTPVQQVPKQ